MYSTLAPERTIPALSTPEKRLKIVIFPLSWVLAHVGRTVEIAKELRARGHEVVFAGDDLSHASSRLGHAAKAGFRTVHVMEPRWHEAWKRFHDHGALRGVWDFLNSQKWAPLDEILEDIIRVVKEEKPDLILGDASCGVSTAGHILGVPAAGILNAYNAQFFKPWSVYRGLIRACDSLKWAHIRRRVYRKHGVAPANAFDLLRAMPLLSPDLLDFHAPEKDYPKWEAVGPILSEPPSTLPDWFDELADGTTNIYLTMGSTGLLEPLLLRTFDTLGQSPYRFIVTTGNQVSAETMARAPKNFRFTDYAPGSRLLEHSAAMVFHGGNGTMYQALAAGVPMLALPSHLEQHVCFSVALREGFGRKANARKITGERLLREIEILLNDPAYRTSAWRHRNAVRHSDGHRKAADLLEAHVRQHQHHRQLARAAR